MRRSHPARPLSTDELSRIDALLEAIDPDAAMVLEELDGFLTGVACSPEPMTDDRALAIVCGEEPAEDDGDDAAVVHSPPPDDAQHAELAALLRQHRLSITAALYAGEGLEPVMEQDEAGASRGNLWAIGFLRAIAAQPDAWAGIDDDPDLLDWLEPCSLLAEEYDLASGARVAPIDGDRQDVIDDMVDSAFAFYHHYEPARTRASAPRTRRLATAAPGRNAPCPCGSGRKYKRCCGAPGGPSAPAA